MPVALVAAAVGATAAVGGALISSSAANNATNEAANAAAQNNALETSIYNQNSANAQPYIQAGDTANSALQAFLGLGGNSAATQAAFDNFLNSTGYQFNYDQGLNAAQQDKAAAGVLNSGGALKALDAYGTGLADQYGQQYATDLSGVAQTGEQAGAALAGAGQNYANAVSSNNNSAASTAANAGLAGASQTNAAINSALKAFSSTQGASSFDSGTGVDASNLNAFVVPGISGVPTATIGG